MKVANIKPAILLNSGTYFNFIDPHHSEFDISDIALGLANTARFGGQSSSFYSVAQHSVLVSAIVPQGLALDALMHDAAEAFIGDIPTPLKQLLLAYKEIEAKVEDAIFAKMDILHTKSPYIKRADLILLATELRDLMPEPGDKWEILDNVEPLEQKIIAVGPNEAFHMFMDRYRYLHGRRQKTKTPRNSAEMELALAS